jgi:hypothetical protein
MNYSMDVGFTVRNDFSFPFGKEWNGFQIIDPDLNNDNVRLQWFHVGVETTYGLRSGLIPNSPIDKHECILWRGWPLCGSRVPKKYDYRRAKFDALFVCAVLEVRKSQRVKLNGIKEGVVLSQAAIQQQVKGKRKRQRN